MESNKFNIHYVCTLQEAEKLIKNYDSFWISNCGCREKKGTCLQSLPDVCLSFSSDFGGTGSNNQKKDKKNALNLLKIAEEKKLVARPFRDPSGQGSTAGICFCCQDCCDYFLNKDEKCDKGSHIELTSFDDCLNCGICENVCYFHARKMESGKLKLYREKCYGCGLCSSVCPVQCIKMIFIRNDKSP